MGSVEPVYTPSLDLVQLSDKTLAACVAFVYDDAAQITFEAVNFMEWKAEHLKFGLMTEHRLAVVLKAVLRIRF